MKPTSETVLELEQPEIEYQRNTRGSSGFPAASETSSVKSLPSQLVGGVFIGELVGFAESGAPLVDFAGNESGAPLVARSTIALNSSQAGREVVLVFEDGKRTKPVILGCIQPQIISETERPVEVKLDGHQLVFTADQEIVLRCGKASITLTRAGKVLIRGAYLLSRSSGVNRIKGGSVQIN